jgi:hypothetical protein
MPRPCADMQKVKGANRTAGPDHDGGSSDPMIPKAVIRTDHFATGKVMSSAITAHCFDGGPSLVLRERQCPV